MMQRPGPNYPGTWGYGPQSYMPGGPAKPMHNPAPGFGAPAQPHPMFQPNACFMPAATLRKISNTTPPTRFYDPGAQ